MPAPISRVIPHQPIRLSNNASHGWLHRPKPCHAVALRQVALACIGLASAAASLQASAQTAPMQLDRVDVITTTPLPGMGLKRDQVPAPVQTATGATLERSGALSLADFANRRLGSVHINEIQNNPFQPDVNFRGYTASPLLGTPQGLSVYLDGVRLNQPLGDVVSWDLIPKTAIATITLVPGSNPLFGLNTLGGALAVQTKDGLKNPGKAVQVSVGSKGRRSGEFELGGANARGLDGYLTGMTFKENGWRPDSHTDVRQLFAKLGWQSPATRATLTGSLADTDLFGNALQERRLLERDYASVYTKPDQTRNRAALLNLAVAHDLGRTLGYSGNAYHRRIHTRTLNGDLNEGALDQSLYTLSAAERSALLRAGIPFPTTAITPANTPFPSLRCIAQGLLNDKPGEQCNGLLNRSATAQNNQGLSAQLTWKGESGAVRHQAVAGAAYDRSTVRFHQSTQLGYLNPDRSITPINSFADGATGGEVDGVPFDNRVDLRSRTTTRSVFAADTLSFGNLAHLSLSGRYNRVKVHSRDQLLSAPDPSSLDGDHQFRRFNPAVGVTWVPSKALSAYAGYNEGSRAPTAVELGCANPANPCKLPNALAGDPPLKQVVTKTVEAGVRGALASSGGRSEGRWHAGVFRAENHDDLLFVAAPDANGFGYFKNFGKTRRQGIELSANRRVGPTDLALSYTQLSATYRSKETVNASGNSSNQAGQGRQGVIDIRPGDRIPLIPRRLLKASAEFDLNEKFALDVDAVGVSGVYARGNENNQHQPDGSYYLGSGKTSGYGVINLGASYKPVAGLKLYARVNNLLDRKYSTAAQLGATGFDGNGIFQARPLPAVNGEFPLQRSTFYAPGAPRSVVVGLRYEFL